MRIRVISFDNSIFQKVSELIKFSKLKNFEKNDEKTMSIRRLKCERKTFYLNHLALFYKTTFIEKSY